ncbi:hypothetical protein O181_019359 [Austropuccinia psidii MF-1]|uniref:Uncharacterized protein n=1 Tax=Austropuccinia psidii MF-1 TaxID=1389203 RepID=A0A9Q3C9D1_9BASI|nr:hypothetical protein [Austropuccinia psidii MF-1]
MFDKARNHENKFMQDSVKCSKGRDGNSHKPLDFKVGDLVLVSTLKLSNIKGPKKLKSPFAQPFMIRALHGPNAEQLELTGELMNKQPAFPLSLIKPYR